MKLVKIGNENLTVKLIPYGARLIDIRLASFNFPLILGYPNITDYRKDIAYLGAIIGRVANRINGTQAKLEVLYITLMKMNAQNKPFMVDQKAVLSKTGR